MSYIHERADWPRFTWDSEALLADLAQLRSKQGRHLGRMEELGFELRSEAKLSMLTVEVVKTSAIEGERLIADEVRSSIARKLGLDVAGLPEPGRQIEGVVEMMVDATRNFSAPLTEDRLFAWHAALFPTGRSGMHPINVGAWRKDESGPMQVVSGPVGKEKVHFQAPAADRLEDEMRTFLSWFESGPSIDPVLMAGVAHFWFVTIHPFDDGNGRLARAIAEMALSRADGTGDRFYSMSSGIESERRDYYRELASAQRSSLDITTWLLWFLGCLDRTLDAAEAALGEVLRKARLWQRINLQPVNERQRLVINRLLDDFEGKLTTSKYAKLTKCSSDTALRDIKELIERGILATNPGGGRSTSYRLVSPDEA